MQQRLAVENKVGWVGWYSSNRDQCWSWRCSGERSKWKIGLSVIWGWSKPGGWGRQQHCWEHFMWQLGLGTHEIMSICPRSINPKQKTPGIYIFPARWGGDGHVERNTVWGRSSEIQILGLSPVWGRCSEIQILGLPPPLSTIHLGQLLKRLLQIAIKEVKRWSIRLVCRSLPDYFSPDT